MTPPNINPPNANPPDGETYARGATLLKQGDYGDSAFLIMSGLVEVFRDERGAKKTLAQLGAGNVVGEMALIDPAPRLASAVAVETTVAKRITMRVLDKALDAAPPLARYLLQTFIRNIRTGTDAMAANPSPAEQQGAAVVMELHQSEKNTGRVLDRRSYGPGDVIFRQEQTGSTAYLIQTGNVSLMRTEADGSMRDLRKLGPGEVFGEMALLNNNWPRYATAMTDTGCSVEVLSAQHFNELMKSSPAIVQALTRNYASLIRSLPAQKQT